MDSERKELERLRRRVDIVRLHLDGRNVSEIAQELDTSSSTVRKWIRRFEEEGASGLASRPSGSGRRRRISDEIRAEIVRLPRDTRPPRELGDQWTSRTLAEVFGVSSSFVSQVWKEADFNAPQHPQQVGRNPFRTVTLRLRLSVPAWFAMHLQLACRELDTTLDGHVVDCLTGHEPLEVLSDERHIPKSLKARWEEQNKQLPREDPEPPGSLNLLDRIRRRIEGEKASNDE